MQKKAVFLRIDGDKLEKIKKLFNEKTASKAVIRIIDMYLSTFKDNIKPYLDDNIKPQFEEKVNTK